MKTEVGLNERMIRRPAKRGRGLMRRIATGVLIAVLIMTSLPNGLMPAAQADPGTYISATPGVFSSYGGSTRIQWDYDYPHPTIIEVYDSSGSVVWGHYGDYGASRACSWTWRGQTYSGPATDGAYAISVIPDDYASQWSQTVVVIVSNPPPAAPTADVGIDDAGNVVVEGSAEPRSQINIYLNNALDGSTVTSIGGSYQYVLGIEYDAFQTVTVTSTARGQESSPSNEEGLRDRTG